MVTRILLLLAAVSLPAPLLAFPGSKYFAENRGQFSPDVLFYGDVGGAATCVRAQDILFCFPQGGGINWLDPMPEFTPVTWSVVPMRFVGATEAPLVRGERKKAFTSNYFIGNDPARWQSRVPHFESVLYESLYPEIDLRLRTVGGRFEYDFIVHPGGELGDVELEFPVAECLEIGPDGDLLVEGSRGTLTQHRPMVYQEVGDQRVIVPVEFEIRGDRRCGFRLMGEFDRSEVLWVDPIVSYATYIGGKAEERADVNTGLPSVAIHPEGDLIYCGTTYSPFSNFTVPGGAYAPYQDVLLGDNDVFVARITPQQGLPDGGIQAFTYYGGTGAGGTSSSDGAYRCAIGPNDHIYVCGSTTSTNLYVPGAVQSTSPGLFDGFVVEFSSDLTQVEFGTYFGGSDYDIAGPLDVVQVGQEIWIYIAGSTRSNLNEGFPFPSTSGHPYDSTFAPTGMQNVCGISGGEQNGFLAVLVDDMSSVDLYYSTYFGGDEGATRSYALDVPVGDTDVYIAGATCSANFEIKPLSTAWDKTLVGLGDFAEGYVVRISPDSNGTQDLVSSTYVGGGVGGQNLEYIFGMYVLHGRVNIVGVTSSVDFPTKRPLLGQDAVTIAATSDLDTHAFTVRIQEDFEGVDFSTYLTGFTQSPESVSDQFEWAYGIHETESSQELVVVGHTNAVDFPVMCTPGVDHCLQSYQGGPLDMFVSILDISGSPVAPPVLEYSSYLGGRDVDRLLGSAMSGGALAIAGVTDGDSFPVPIDVYQEEYEDISQSYDGVLVQMVIGAGDFIRGDVDADGDVDSQDLVLLAMIVANSYLSPCPDALDLNDDGFYSGADVTYMYSHLYASGPDPVTPFPSCGGDPTADGYTHCHNDACP